MDKRSEFEISNEQRSLLNAGHGPPSRIPTTNQFCGIKGYRSDPDFDSKKTVPGGCFYDRSTPDTATPVLNLKSAARMGFDICGYGRYNFQEPLPNWNTSDGFSDKRMLLEANQENEEHARMRRHEMQVAEANRIVLDNLARQNEDLKSKMALKLKEMKELENMYCCNGCTYQRLKHQLTLLPNLSTRLQASVNSTQSNFINLVDTSEPFWLSETDARDEDDEAMMKSVQCSEASAEEMNEKVEEPLGRPLSSGSPVCKRKGAGVSTSSSSLSFEIVGHGSCAGSPKTRPLCDGVFREFEPLPLAEVSKTATSNIEDKLAILKSEIKELKSENDGLARKLEAEKEERRVEMAELKEKLNEIIQRQKTENEPDKKNLEVTQSEALSDDLLPKLYDLQKKIDELETSNWKLGEQNVEMMRENEELKKMTQEQELKNSSVSKLQDDLIREQQRATIAEQQLSAERRRTFEMEARIQELKSVHSRQSPQQQGMESNETAKELMTENALLKHQIDAYKEDFEVERKDREKLNSQKDSLQRCYDILRGDLDGARSQVRKYENDVSLLRIDNNALKAKLREVMEELGALKGQQQLPRTTAAGACATQNYTLAPKTVMQNTFDPKPSSPATVKSEEWECKICTYKNQAPRSYCEMCGTHEPGRSSSASQNPAVTYVPNIPVPKSPPAHWNVAAPPATPLLSNLRNYGDIETD